MTYAVLLISEINIFLVRFIVCHYSKLKRPEAVLASGSLSSKLHS